MTSRCFVKDGHTLGVIRDERPDWFEPLAGSVLKGGHDWRNGPVPISPMDKIVPATLEDFDFFRVDPRGHLTK